MSNVSSDRNPTEARRFWALPLWIGLAVVLVVGAAVYYLWQPRQREQSVVPEKKRLDAPPTNEDLWRAAKMGQADVVEALLAGGAERRCRDRLWRHRAAVRRRAGTSGRCARCSLRTGPMSINRTASMEVAPLASAASKQQWKVVAALLEAGARGAEEILPSAAAAGQVEVVRVALETGTISGAVLNRALASAPQDQTEIIELLETAGARRANTDPDKSVEFKVPLAAFVGRYRDESGFELGVRLDAGKLALTADDRPIATLVRSGEDVFTAADDVATTFEFEREGEQYVRFVRTHLDSTVTFERGPFPRAASRYSETDDDDAGAIVPQNWPSFRGPQATGVADGQKPPTSWDVENSINVRWKAPIAGLGHACPIVWEDRVYVTTAVRADGKSELKVGLYGDVDAADDLTEHSWRTICLDKNSGDVLWEKVAHHGTPRTKRHTKGSHANCTPATDGAHIVVNFGSEGLYCYDSGGRLLWHNDLGTLSSGWFFDEDYQWGFGSSPVIYRGLVIIQCDVGRGSYIAALRLADGSEAWRTSRDEIPSWGSPTLVEIPGRTELVTNATRFVRGYDPATGKELWRLARQSEITVPTPFYADGLIFIVSGYSPIQPIYAIRAGASGDISLGKGKTSNEFVSWSNPKAGSYLPTPIAYRGHLYVCSNSGIVGCFDVPTGREIYKKRLPGSGRIYRLPRRRRRQVVLHERTGAGHRAQGGSRI